MCFGLKCGVLRVVRAIPLCYRRSHFSWGSGPFSVGIFRVVYFRGAFSGVEEWYGGRDRAVGEVTVRKRLKSFRSVATRRCFRNRRVRLVYYTAFRRIFRGVGQSPAVVNVYTVRGAVTNDLLRGCRLLQRDKAAIINRRGLRVRRDVYYLPSSS